MTLTPGRSRSTSDQGAVNAVVSAISNNKFQTFAEKLVELKNKATGGGWHQTLYNTVRTSFPHNKAAQRQYYQELIILEVPCDKDFFETNILPLFQELVFMGPSYKAVLLDRLDTAARDNGAYKSALFNHYTANQSQLRDLLSAPRYSSKVAPGASTKSLLAFEAIYEKHGGIRRPPLQNHVSHIK